jgi:hypothetical protein
MKTDSLFYRLLQAQPTLAFELVYKLPAFTREEILKMFNFTDVGLKETRFYRDVLTEGEATMLLRLLERTTARCPSPPASASPPPMPKPCWRGASASSTPTAWMRFGGIEAFAFGAKPGGG